ncbi:MAG: serine protease [Trichloromonas sp.]|jgi:hypothetical protein|nr:serine protease [Trichloromonas sp.]
MNPVSFLGELEKAANEFRNGDVANLLGQVNVAEFDDKQIKKTLTILRRKRLFPELEATTKKLIDCGKETPLVRRQQIQSLIDQNRVEDAIATLQTLPTELRNDPLERPELCGLTGRAYKQLFVNGAGEENLLQAIREYEPCWSNRLGDYRWHGINLVALLARAERERITIPVGLDKESLAREILREIDDLEQKATIWDYGTAMEASIALRDTEGALGWAKKYVRHPDVDAFELGSTLRQMKEVWKLTDTELGNKLLPVLEYELLQRQGAELQVTSLSVEDREGFQAVYGNEAAVPIIWLENMFERCKAVGRVLRTGTGEAIGTGFLIKGSELCKGWGDEPVFVTNAHVISDRHEDEAPLQSGDGSVEFTRIDGRPRVELGNILHTSPKTELDVTVLQVIPPSGVSMLRPSLYPPVVPGDGQAPQRIYVIGHPGGRELEVTLYDNSIVACSDIRFLHYRSPTEGGHSGSPVFTREWKTIAVHHRARQELQVNEGVLFEPISMAIRV